MAPKPQPLDERVRNFRAELDAFIDARVAEIKKTCPGVPEGVLRNTLTRGMCQCGVVLEIMRTDEEQAAKESAA
jgi:hypothetical protein